MPTCPQCNDRIGPTPTDYIHHLERGHLRPSFFREWCTWCGGKTCRTGVWNGLASPCDSTCCSRHTHMDTVS